MPQLQQELDYELYFPGYGLKYTMGFDDPMLEKFLDKLAGLLLYQSYNTVHVPTPFIEKVKGRIKRVYSEDDTVCIDLVNGETYCAGLGEGVEGTYYEMTDEEFDELVKMGEEIFRRVVEKMKEAMKKGKDEWYGWIESDNPDGYAFYEIVILKK